MDTIEVMKEQRINPPLRRIREAVGPGGYDTCLAGGGVAFSSSVVGGKPGLEKVGNWYKLSESGQSIWEENLAEVFTVEGARKAFIDENELSSRLDKAFAEYEERRERHVFTKVEGMISKHGDALKNEWRKELNSSQQSIIEVIKTTPEELWAKVLSDEVLKRVKQAHDAQVQTLAEKIQQLERRIEELEVND